MALAQISVAGYQGNSEMERREVKTHCGSGSPCGAPEMLVHMVMTSSACLGRHAKHLQPLWHAEGLMEIPCLSLLPQACIICPGQAVHSCPPRGCRDLHILFAKRCEAKFPLPHGCLCQLTSWATFPCDQSEHELLLPKSTSQLPGWKSWLPCHSSSLLLAPEPRCSCFGSEVLCVLGTAGIIRAFGAPRSSWPLKSFANFSVRSRSA